MLRTASDLLKERNAPPYPDAVRLVIRSTDYIKHAQASLGENASGLNLQLRPFVDGLVAVAVLDTPRAVRTLSDKDLEKIGLSEEQLFALGAKNVRAALRPLSETAKLEPSMATSTRLAASRCMMTGRPWHLRKTECC